MNSLRKHEHQSLLRFRASDGFQINALLVTPEGVPRDEFQETPILLQIHGILGHFLARGTPRQLPHELLQRGCSSLSIDTRLAHQGQMTGEGIFENTILDIDASVDLLRNEGFRNIYVLGYSLGASLVVYWAASRTDLPIRGLVLEGCPFSMPDSRRARWAKWNSIPSAEEIHQQAIDFLGPDPASCEKDQTFLIRRCKGATEEPMFSEIYTYRTYWHMLSPMATSAMSYKHIARVPYPVLFLQGENDYLLQTEEIEALAMIARNAGNQGITFERIPDARHDCLENPEVMLDHLTHFMEAYSA